VRTKALSLQPENPKRIETHPFADRQSGVYLTNIMEMFKTLLFTLLIIAISIALLSITILIKKNGKFPNIHIGGNKNMRKRGIKCAQSQDRDARKENPMAVRETSKK
jgi:hypothetical protein